MPQVKDLLVEQLQDLLHAERQLIGALPKMAEAANNPKLKENFQKHFIETENHLARLEQVFALLGEQLEPKPCKAMMGLMEEGKETMKEGKEKDLLIADLALITIAQKVEHYEISAYGTAKALARQIGEIEVAKLLCQTLGDEEAADAMLTMCTKPILQQATIDDLEDEEDEDDFDEDRGIEFPISRGRDEVKR